MDAATFGFQEFFEKYPPGCHWCVSAERDALRVDLLEATVEVNTLRVITADVDPTVYEQLAAAGKERDEYKALATLCSPKTVGVVAERDALMAQLEAAGKERIQALEARDELGARLDHTDAQLVEAHNRLNGVLSLSKENLEAVHILLEQAGWKFGMNITAAVVSALRAKTGIPGTTDCCDTCRRRKPGAGLHRCEACGHLCPAMSAP